MPIASGQALSVDALSQSATPSGVMTGNTWNKCSGARRRNLSSLGHA